MATLVQRVTALAQRIAQEFKSVSPDGGTAGQVLTKTASGNAWQDIKALPDGGTTGQVLTKTASGETWKDLAEIDVLPDDGTAGQVLTVDSSGNLDWQDPNYLPTGGSSGQVLTKTASGETWQDIKALPDGGSSGQILTKTASGEAWLDAPKEVPTIGTTGQILTKTATGNAWKDAPVELPTGGTTLQVLAKTDDGTGKEWKTTVTAGEDTPESRTQTELLYLQYGDTDTADTVNVHKYVLQAYQFTFDDSDGLYHLTIDKQPYEHIVGVYQEGELVLADVAEEEDKAHITALQPITGYAMFGFSGAAEGSITLAGQLERIDNLEINKVTAAQAAHAAMPSDVYVELTAVANTQYTAPADGYFDVVGVASTAGGMLSLTATGGFVSASQRPYTSGLSISTNLPCKKNDVVLLTATNVGALTLKFFYAEGSKP